MKKRAACTCIITELNYKQMNRKVIDKSICRHNHISLMIISFIDNKSGIYLPAAGKGLRPVNTMVLSCLCLTRASRNPSLALLLMFHKTL